MKIIHCADVHLDSKMSRYLSSEKALERNAELLHTFQRMIWFAKSNGVAAILIAGDLFDTGKVSATAKQVILAEINGNSEITFFYLKGNHDKNTFLMDQEEVPENLKMFGYEWTSYRLGETIVVTGIEFNKENVGTIYESLNLNSEKFHIVMLHGQDVAHRGKEDGETIHLPRLRGKGIDYLALGHIHAYKEERLDYRGLSCYPGCLEGRGFDECGEHGFVLLDVDEQSMQYERTFVPFAKRRLYEVFVDISECRNTADIISAVERKLAAQDYGSESMLKLVLTGEISIDCEKNIKYIQQYFQVNYYLLKVEDETRLKIEPRDFQFDESLKGEFVRTVLSDASLCEEEKSKIIRYGILALAGERR